MVEAAASDTTRDAFYDGRLLLRQPRTGHRSGTDAVLLAATVPRNFDGLVIDAGAGVGAAGLGVGLLCPRARVLLLENHAPTADLARDNVESNGLAGRVGVVTCDLLDRAARTAASPGPADLVVTNPPFYAAGTVRVSPSAHRGASHVLAEGRDLADWIRACLDLLTPRGRLIVIHEPSALTALLGVAAGRLGGLALCAVHPRAGAPAKRILLRGQRGSRAPLSLRPPLVLNGPDGFTSEAEAIHRGLATIAAFDAD